MDLSTLQGVLSVLQFNGYWIIFIIMFLEGPLIAYAAGFASSLDIFNLYFVCFLAILGNFIPDMILYFMGRLIRGILHTRFFRLFGLSKKVILRIEKGFKKHLFKTMLVTKLAPLLPVPGLILAGVLKVKFKKFVFYDLLITIPSTIFFVLLGYYSGITYITLAKTLKIGSILMPVIILLVIVVWLLFRKFAKKVERDFEEGKDKF